MRQLRSFSDLRWVSQSMVNRVDAGPTVNGRTLIATLMEEAPSVAAITAGQATCLWAMTVWAPKLFYERGKDDH